MKNTHSLRPVTFLLLLFAGIYLFVVFPFTYFRHDDWLILGNAIYWFPKQKDWSFIWRPTLFFLDREFTWFFRPFFKLGTYVFFQAFGYHYTLWLATLLACLVGAICLGYLTVLELTASSYSATVFVFLFVSAVHLHFANLVWMGEAMMNCPQVLLLILATYAFCRGLQSKKGWLWNSLGVVSYALSLGFKESSLFQPFFLLGVCFGESRFRNEARRGKILALFPYGMVGLAYALMRFFRMPMNRAYLSQIELSGILVSCGLLMASLGAPLLVLLVWLRLSGKNHLRDYLRALSAKGWYLPYFALVLAPYFGHPFFSPGWLLLPGFFFLLTACLVPLDRNCIPRLAVLALGVFLVCAAPVVFQTCRLGWWQWHRGQRLFETYLREADPTKVHEIQIHNCPNPAYPHSGFQRVIAYEECVENLWLIQHQTPVRILITGCQNDGDRTGVLHLQWRFPELTVREQ